MSDLVFTIADDAEFHLRVLRPLETVHRLGIGDLLADKDGVIDLHDLITSQHTSPFRRTVADDILHTDRILTDGKLDTDTRERATQIVVGNLTVTSRDIDRMRIEFCQDLRHCLLHQIVDVHGIDILIVDDMKQVVELVTAGVDDVQPVA